MSQKTCAVQVAHQVGHRTRFKVDKSHRSEANLDRIKVALEGADGVKSVNVNDKTGSVTVHHGVEVEVTERYHELIGNLMCECVEVVVEAVEPELVPFAVIITKFFPASAGVTTKQVLVPLGLIGLGLLGGYQFRGFIAKIASHFVI